MAGRGGEGVELRRGRQRASVVALIPVAQRSDQVAIEEEEPVLPAERHAAL
jgi:hypothetical protein